MFLQTVSCPVYLIATNSVILNGCSVTLSGYSVTLSGYFVTLSGYSVTLSGYSVTLSSYFVTLSAAEGSFPFRFFGKLRMTRNLLPN